MLCISWMRSAPTRSVSMPLIAFRLRFMSSGNCGSTVTPVPTALPPMPRSFR
jgi:hypothetical protein